MKKIIKFLLTKLPSRKSTSGEAGTFKFAHGIMGVDRIALVNHLVVDRGFVSYLEIGVRDKNDMYNKINIEKRVSVDPDPNAQADYCLTSDLYFETNQETFDVIFIDGLHEGEQVRRDITNSLAVLNPGGMILLHDLNPPRSFHARDIYEVDGKFPAWNGTAWEGFAWHRQNSPELEMCVVDTDWGVGIIERGKQILWTGPISGYSNLADNRKSLLKLISVKDFLKKF